MILTNRNLDVKQVKNGFRVFINMPKTTNEMKSKLFTTKTKADNAKSLLIGRVLDDDNTTINKYIHYLRIITILQTTIGKLIFHSRVENNNNCLKQYKALVY